MFTSHDDETRPNEPISELDLTLDPQPPDKEKIFTTNVVTVCIKGIHNNYAANSERITLMNAILGAIVSKQWQNVDVVLFPAGFLSLKEPIGHKNDLKRLKALDTSRIGLALKAASLRLSRVHKSCMLIAGIDSQALSKHYGGDQFVLAVQNGEVKGLSRKAFPVDGDTNGYVPRYWVRKSDCESLYRFVTLRNGAKAILLVCYDAYGLRAIRDKKYYPLLALRYKRQSRFSLTYLKPNKREIYLNRFITQVKEEAPNIALIGIHWFKRAGGDGYWQRHGIAGASSALDGKPVIAASHFVKSLPTTITSSPLASENVPLEHLTQGNARCAHRLNPQDGFALYKQKSKSLKSKSKKLVFEQPTPKAKSIALVRLFKLHHD